MKDSSLVWVAQWAVFNVLSVSFLSAPGVAVAGSEGAKLLVTATVLKHANIEVLALLAGGVFALAVVALIARPLLFASVDPAWALSCKWARRAAASRRAPVAGV